MTSFTARTIDYLYNLVMVEVCEQPKVPSRNGPMRQKVGVQLTLLDPTSNILMNSNRKMSTKYASGELFWYLNQSNMLSQIQHYAPSYEKYSDDGTTLNGAYGARLRMACGSASRSFIECVVQELRVDPWTRRLVLPIYDREDVGKDSKDIPCTLSLQFLLDNDGLHLICNMRSNDLWYGFPYDVFCFTTIQQLVANYGGWKLGTYVHQVGSLHAYEKHVDRLRQDEVCVSGSICNTSLYGVDITTDILQQCAAEARVRDGSMTISSRDTFWDDLLGMSEGVA